MNGFFLMTPEFAWFDKLTISGISSPRILSLSKDAPPWCNLRILFTGNLKFVCHEGWSKILRAPGRLAWETASTPALSG
jgi:hypothetical protein